MCPSVVPQNGFVQQLAEALDVQMVKRDKRQVGEEVAKERGRRKDAEEAAAEAVTARLSAHRLVTQLQVASFYFTSGCLDVLVCEWV